MKKLTPKQKRLAAERVECAKREVAQCLLLCRRRDNKDGPWMAQLRKAERRLKDAEYALKTGVE